MADVVGRDEDQMEFPGMPEPITPPDPDPYFLEGYAESKARVKVDLSGLINKHEVHYTTVDISAGYQYWERPMVFLWEYLANEQPSYHEDGIEQMWDDFEFREHPDWSLEHFEALAAICPVVARVKDLDIT